MERRRRCASCSDAHIEQEVAAALLEHEAQAQEAAADHSAAIPDDHAAPDAEERMEDAHADPERTMEQEEPMNQATYAREEQAQAEPAEAQAEPAKAAAQPEVAERLGEPEAAERLVLVYPGRSSSGAEIRDRECLAKYRADRGQRQRRTCGARSEDSGERTSEQRRSWTEPQSRDDD